MASWTQHRLTAAQAILLDGWLPGAEICRDHSWGLIDTVVLEVAAGGLRYVVKASGADNHHLGRELDAHEQVIPDLAGRGLAPCLVFADRAAHMLVTQFLDGELVLGHPAETDPSAYVRAGELLRSFHGQRARRDHDFEAKATTRSLASLDLPHRIAPGLEQHARSILRHAPPVSTSVVPTHGDWQPRNWLIDAAGVVKMIDFGRFGFRPAATDLARLATQQWRGRPDLEAAFFQGYGEDPREPDAWRLILLREAIGTAVWAFQVGEDSFEQQGHRLLGEALARFAD